MSNVIGMFMCLLALSSWISFKRTERRERQAICSHDWQEFSPYWYKEGQKHQRTCRLCKKLEFWRGETWM